MRAATGACGVAIWLAHSVGAPLPCLFRFVIQIRPEPSLDRAQIHLLAQVIINDLIASDFADREILRLRVREIKPADAGAGPHGAAFGKPNASVALDVQQLPERPFFGMVRASGIAGGRPDAPILLAD